VKIRRSRRQSRLLIAVVFSIPAFLSPAAVSCQTSSKLPRQDFQGWAAIEATHPVNERTDFIVSTELRYSDDLGHSVFRRITTGVAFRRFHFFTIEPYYQYSVTDAAGGRFSHEHRLAIVAAVSGSWKNWYLSHRHTGEGRFVENRRIWRYRNRAEVRRPMTIAGRQLTLFAWDEIYYGTDARRWYRNRAALGFGKRINDRISVDVFYAHQNDGISRPGDLRAILRRVFNGRLHFCHWQAANQSLAAVDLGRKRFPLRYLSLPTHGLFVNQTNRNDRTA